MTRLSVRNCRLQTGGETFEDDVNLTLFPKTDTVENEAARHSQAVLVRLFTPH
jgi:hypothetical protein